MVIPGESLRLFRLGMAVEQIRYRLGSRYFGVIQIDCKNEIVVLFKRRPTLYEELDCIALAEGIELRFRPW